MTATSTSTDLSSIDEVTSVCCPGKVLVAGGYLVLESPNPGLVLGAHGAGGRFFASCTTLASSDASSLVLASPDGYSRQRLDVHSPQFDTVFRYWLDYAVDDMAGGAGAAHDDDHFVLLRLVPRNVQEHMPNPYLEKTLSLTLSYVQYTLGVAKFASVISDITAGGIRILSIKIRAGNDFYSPLPHLKARKLEATPASVASLPQFLPCPKVKDKATGNENIVVNKTGMGSSAALVTSVVGVVLSHFGTVAMPQLGGEGDTSGQHSKEDMKVIHNLAQICHCSAQGKIGSGFDVSAATYASHVYRRFSKEILAQLLDDICDSNASTGTFSSEAKGDFAVTKIVATSMADIVNDANGTIWDAQTIPLGLPQGLELLMADVCGGSESPSMARKVLAWKNDLAEASNNPWERLKKTNLALEDLFVKEFTKPHFLRGLKKYSNELARTSADKWLDDIDLTGEAEVNAISTLLRARELFMISRRDLKELGESSGVPVEPDGQTELADATMELPGVIAAGVPGAGGYDALFVLYVKGRDINGGQSDVVREKIGELWRSWAGQNPGGEVEFVCPLGVRGAGKDGFFGICSSDLAW